jgi:hypothetical protein
MDRREGWRAKLHLSVVIARKWGENEKIEIGMVCDPLLIE